MLMSPDPTLPVRPTRRPPATGSTPARPAGGGSSGDRLEQVAFAAAADLPEAVAREFAEATRSVPLDRVDLGDREGRRDR